MAVTSLANNDVIVQLVPGGSPTFAQVSDDELLANTRRLVGKSNQLLAVLLAHLAEVETRGVHRSRSCASLYTYCIYELRFSEDAAARRSAAARFAKEFPALLEAVAAGELHLTGLLMIGPHLTSENHETVLARAKFRTKKELTKLVRELNPLPELPDRIEPIGPELRRSSTRSPSWQDMVAARAPQVRELPADERPCNWANDGVEDGPEDDVEQEGANPSVIESALPVGPVPSDLPPITRPQLFRLQLCIVEEHVQLIERARALLARERPRITLGELHLEAMRLLVATLEKRKFAVKEASRMEPSSTKSSRAEPSCTDPERAEPSRAEPSPMDPPRQRGDSSEVEARAGTARSHSRYVPAAVRREVYRRDDARCSFIDVRGERCCETRYLELHHLQPFARAGKSVASNLTLRCSVHNALAAEQDFGVQQIVRRRHATRHEALTAQTRVKRPPVV
jgi:hypothetical protein